MGNLYKMPDGNDYEFASDAEANKAMAAWNVQFGGAAPKATAAPAPTPVVEDSGIVNPIRALGQNLYSRYQRGTILNPDEEQFLRRTLQSAASGPVMGAVQLGAGMLGAKDVEQKIAQTAKEGNMLGSFLQPEAWLTGGAIGNAATLGKRVLAGAGLGSAYGGLSATEDTTNPMEARGKTAAISGLLGGGIPVATTALSKLGGGIENLKNTIQAAMGNKGAIEDLAGDAARSLAKADKQFIESALANRSQYVPGVKPTVAEAIAEQNIGKASQTGGATIRMQKTLSGAVGAEDIIPTAMRAQQAAIQTYREGVESALAPVRTSILRRANRTGIDTTPILQKIDTMMQTPGDREAEMVKRVLPILRQKIDDMKQSSPNIVDARDIYSLRKNLYKSIKDMSKETGTWDKKLGAKLERDIQLEIDAAIDSVVGNNMWSRGYVKPYSDRMASVRAHEGRLEEAKEIAKGVKSSSTATLTAGEVPQLPNVLSRPISAINYALKKALGDANSPVAKELARRMTDPDEYAKLLAAPANDPMRQLAAKVVAISAGQAVDQEEQ